MALTLMGLVLTTIFSGLYGLTRAWSRAEILAEENDATRMGLSLLRRILSESVPITRVDGQNPAVLFQGEADALRWVAPLPSHAGGTGLYWTELSVHRTALGESQLVVTYMPLRPDTLPSTASFEHDSESVVLAEGAEQLEIAYYGTSQEDLAPRWQASWAAIDRLPTLVRLTLRQRAGEVAWPPLVVPLRIPAQRGQPQWTLIAPQTVSG